LILLGYFAAYHAAIELCQGDDGLSQRIYGKPPAVLAQPAGLGGRSDVAGELLDVGARQYHLAMPKKIDVVERLRLHVEWSTKRDDWARRAIDLLEKGDEHAGMDAAEKAEYWDLKVKSLEP
jgi:hypothetical protein